MPTGGRAWQLFPVLEHSLKANGDGDGRGEVRSRWRLTSAYKTESFSGPVPSTTTVCSAPSVGIMIE